MKSPHSKSSLHILTLASLFISLIGGAVFVTPAHAAGIVVNSLLDSFTYDTNCTLREAIWNANDNAMSSADCAAGSGADTITFSVSGAITLGSTLPSITDAAGLTMDGTGQTVTIDGNHAVGVLMVGPGASLTLNNLTIANGNFGSNGGGIYNEGDTLVITNSTFSDNSGYNGGSIYNNNSTGTLTVTNSTFSGNSATGSSGGGGIYKNTGTLTITNSTFSGNSATYGGGIYNYGTSTVTLLNTIVANSTGGNCDGTITNGGNNIDSGTTCGWGAVSGSMSGTDPLLGALADNGGPTQTFALLTGSLAIDAGDDFTCGAAPVNGLDHRDVESAREANRIAQRGFGKPECDQNVTFENRNQAIVKAAVSGFKVVQNVPEPPTSAADAIFSALSDLIIKPFTDSVPVVLESQNKP